MTTKSKIKKHQNCWEYWHCKDDAKAQYPVYKSKDGRKCWVYIHSLDVFDWAKPKKEYENCFDCPWYKKVNKLSN